MDKIQYISSDFLAPKDAWDRLPLARKAEIMRVAVNNGITNLLDIRKEYNEFAMGGDTYEEEMKIPSLSEAKRMGVMVGVAPFVKKKEYIGGTPQEARDKYWQMDNEMRILTDSVANEYQINPELLRSRMDQEGYTDTRIAEINKDIKKGTNRALTGDALFHSEAMPYVAGEEFGLDDTATYINNGTVNLINENWSDAQGQNEKGRWTNLAAGHNYSDNVGIMAATLKAFRELAKKDFPWASEADLDRYAQAYYNRGIEGGRKWAKKGAQGYKINKHAIGGPIVEMANTYGEGGDEGNNPMNYKILGTVHDDSLKNEGITQVAFLPEVTVVGKNKTKSYYSSYDSSIKPYGEFFGALSHGLQPLSPSQHVGAAFDAIKGRRGYFDSLFNGNSGFVSDDWAKDHPIASMATNAVLDAGTGIVFSQATKIPSFFIKPKNLASSTATEIDNGIKEAATNRMMDFINSPDYSERLQRAGLSKYWDKIGDFIAGRITRENFFPTKMDDSLPTAGRTYYDNKGIFISPQTIGEEFQPTLDHELSHWSTGVIGDNFFKNLIESIRYKKPWNNNIRKIMKYNKSLIDAKNQEDFTKEWFKWKNISNPTEEELKEATEIYKYLKSPQETRARAYATLQDAKRKGLTIDEYVDKYIPNGNMTYGTPDDLWGLGLIMSPENTKGYIKNFLSISAPTALGTKLYSNLNTEDNEGR